MPGGKNHRIIAMAMWPQGSQMADMAFSEVQKSLVKKKCMVWIMLI
jgi:hypothetical protein